MPRLNKSPYCQCISLNHRSSQNTLGCSQHLNRKFTASLVSHLQIAVRDIWPLSDQRINGNKVRLKASLGLLCMQVVPRVGRVLLSIKRWYRALSVRRVSRRPRAEPRKSIQTILNGMTSLPSTLEQACTGTAMMICGPASPSQWLVCWALN